MFNAPQHSRGLGQHAQTESKETNRNVNVVFRVCVFLTLRCKLAKTSKAFMLLRLHTAAAPSLAAVGRSAYGPELIGMPLSHCFLITYRSARNEMQSSCRWLSLLRRDKCLQNTAIEQRWAKVFNVCEHIEAELNIPPPENVELMFDHSLKQSLTKMSYREVMP